MLSEQNKSWVAREHLFDGPSSRPNGPSSRPEAPSSRRLLIGFNHNVRFNARIFHVQTEDMGRHNGYAITHVFNDRGRVVKTRKVSYTELLSDPEAKTKIRILVRDQHQLVVEEVSQGFFEEEYPPSSFIRKGGALNAESHMPPSGTKPVDKPTPIAEIANPTERGAPVAPRDP